jgi:subtilisin
VLQDAITDAASVGSVVFAATGNEGSPTVSFPASCKDAVGISAFGVAGTYPIDTPHDAEIGAPRLGSDFFAAFSNYGTEVRFIGPGVGIISTAPGGGYSVRSGTSMACAAATGLSARLLAGDSALLNSPRNDARSAAIQNMLQAHAVSLGFGFLYEGAGRL